MLEVDEDRRGDARAVGLDIDCMKRRLWLVGCVGEGVVGLRAGEWMLLGLDGV